MDKFQQLQENIGTNMAVVMFMVEALRFFEGKPLLEIKQMAIEIAMQGTQGFRPDREDYRIHSIAGKTFSGYQILAYYYTSFKIALPHMVNELQLPFEEEYQMALGMYKK